MVSQLIKIGFNDPKIFVINAHTLPEENASVKVLKKCGFQFVGETYEDEEGILWKWILSRD